MELKVSKDSFVFIGNVKEFKHMMKFLVSKYGSKATVREICADLRSKMGALMAFSSTKEVIAEDLN